MKSKILQIHGFASAGEGSKASELREMFPKHEVLSPSLSTIPAKAFAQLCEIIDNSGVEDTVVLGTSLGGFYGLCLAAHYSIPAIILNPSTRPHINLRRALGVQKNLKTLEEFSFTEEHLIQLEEMKSRLTEESLYYADLRIFINRDDEVIDPDYCAKDLPFLSHSITYFESGGHRFENLGLIKDALSKMLG